MQASVITTGFNLRIGQIGTRTRAAELCPFAELRRLTQEAGIFVPPGRTFPKGQLPGLLSLRIFLGNTVVDDGVWNSEKLYWQSSCCFLAVLVLMTRKDSRPMTLKS